MLRKDFQNELTFRRGYHYGLTRISGGTLYCDFGNHIYGQYCTGPMNTQPNVHDIIKLTDEPKGHSFSLEVTFTHTLCGEKSFQKEKKKVGVK